MNLPNLPLVTAPVVVGERVWHVTAVQNQDALLDAAEWFPHFPYGLLLWESAVGLARMLAARPEQVAGKRVLELGAGVGLPGLVAQSLSAQVWQTDHQARALLLAHENADRNGITGVERFVADWRAWARRERYEVILGADILYERGMHFYLEAIFRQNLAPGGCLLLSDPGRPQALECLARLESSGWQIVLETEPVLLEEEGRDNRPVEVALMTCTRARE